MRASSNGSSVGTIEILATTEVIINDKFSWHVSDEQDLYEAIMQAIGQ